MNVALFASAFYPHLGGVEELVRQLAHAYRARGLNPIVVTNRWPRSLPVYEEYEGIPVHRPAFRMPDGTVQARLTHALTHRRIRAEILTVLRRHEINLLHVQCVSSNGYYALLAKRALDLPLVVTTQGERLMDAGRIYQKSSFMNRVLRQLLDEAEAVTGCSQNTLSDMEEYFGQPLGQRGGVIYNGIRLADFETPRKYSHPSPYILGIGRLVPQKGFDVLIEAYARAIGENQPTHDLLIAGEGPEREALEALVCRLKLTERVHFLGRAERETAVALFHGCSFFVLPSRHEPMGIVNLEAMAAGKAIIASNVGGVPELVQNEVNGLLVPGDDKAALAQAISRLAGDVALRTRLGEGGRECVQRFDWPTIADQYQAVYEAARARHRSKSGLVNVETRVEK